jgi:hypothetical protein
MNLALLCLAMANTIDTSKLALIPQGAAYGLLIGLSVVFCGVIFLPTVRLATMNISDFPESSARYAFWTFTETKMTPQNTTLRPMSQSYGRERIVCIRSLQLLDVDQ